MNRLLVLMISAMLSLPALAATPQQNKMKTCNAEAKAKKLVGPERKKFMSECLSGAPAAVPQAAAEAPAAATDKPKMTQREKMKSCNADAKAKDLKGPERKKFMSECLKG